MKKIEALFEHMKAIFKRPGKVSRREGKLKKVKKTGLKGADHSKGFIFFRESIMGKIISCFTGIILLSLITVGFASYIEINNQVKSQFVSNTNEILAQSRNYVDLVTDMVDNYSMQIFTDKNIKGYMAVGENASDYDKFMVSQNISKSLSTITSTSNILDSIFLINPDGVSVGFPKTYSPKDGSNIKEKDYYKKAEELGGKSFWIPPHKQDKSTDEAVIMSHTRLFNDMDTNKKLGLIMIDIRPDVIQSALADAKIGKNGYLYVVDEDGFIISHPDNSVLGKNIKDDVSVKGALSGEEGQYTYTKDNIKMFAVYTTSSKTGWKYIATLPERELTSSADNIRNIIILICIICLATTIFLSIKITLLFIVRPLNKVKAAMAAVEEGDLSVSVSYGSKDEFGQLGNSFNKMVSNLKVLIGEVRDAVTASGGASKMVEESSRQLSESTTEVSRVIEEIAAGAGEQAQHASQSVETAEGFGKEVEAVVSYTRDVHGASNTAMEKIREGTGAVEMLKGKSLESADVIRRVSDTISELSNNTREIEDILATITGIAEQTNLLSLNAAIEAARAGEAGRGFAVVANEVRNLADESKEAADNIGLIIKNVNTRTKEAVENAKSIVTVVEEQVRYIENTMDAFSHISGSMGMVDEKLDKLNGAINNISDGKENILKSIEQIASVSQETAASTEQISASTQEQAASVEEMAKMAEQLNDLSVKLNELTERFKIS